MFRFIHSSDLHLGKPFGRFDGDLPALLRAARYAALGRLAGAARAHGAGVILLAGDTFDAETPAPATIRHALQAMAEASDLTWVILPGNHDSLAALDLWRRVAEAQPDNVRLALDPTPIGIGPAAILPAPCTARRPGRDLTSVLDQATPEGALRIGLAHGAVTEFSEEGDAALIPPDRAARSGLEYLGLGDWHGQMPIGARSWYSGTPEADSFKHDAPATALAVTLAGPGAAPEVMPVATGDYAWVTTRPDLLPGEDVEARLAGLLPPPEARRRTLFRLHPQGRLTLAERTLLETGARALREDFAWFEAELGGLSIHHDVTDLDEIDRAGALRRAAEALWEEAQSPALSEEDREIAAAALARLYALASEVA
ncbi:metallophosphoesterase family protein [Rhodovulum adriaticum]|uniref:DNA repair exonuclease SbcCD nuclease subunit n=1 Tax=Rhodovulum adriaticum TaxID=35804 RepID=A0A4R2NXA9_RHOAD|nr:metallophosphoesterase [Rhodovulum adriaticum]MBK1634340.1 DNA repair exonuclease [Rhodovulum adriaticum]TCP26055.1 DNA repair exonuclease SbcCD nuclease subunit [Rhodovulum adriaticum]